MAKRNGAFAVRFCLRLRVARLIGCPCSCGLCGLRCALLWRATHAPFRFAGRGRRWIARAVVIVKARGGSSGQDGKTESRARKGVRWRVAHILIHSKIHFFNELQFLIALNGKFLIFQTALNGRFLRGWIAVNAQAIAARKYIITFSISSHPTSQKRRVSCNFCIPKNATFATVFVKIVSCYAEFQKCRSPYQGH